MLVFLTMLACLPDFPNRKSEYLENPDGDYDQDGFTENDGDCNDDDPTTFPEADELCDGVDNDCNGLLDDEPVDAQNFYLDADGDEIGRINFTVTECEAPVGYIPLVFDEAGNILDDCDDDDRFVNPLAVEFCDGKDNDCDDDIDDADDDLQGNAFWYRDSDGDTFPSNAERREECSQPTGFVQGDETLPTELIDCNDADASINPGANEVCDQIDNDCDGLVDDADTEEVMDHVWTIDVDEDGFGDATPGADTQATCIPPVGYARLATDCDDNNSEIHPEATEVCDYIDQNCNGQVDEGQGVKISWYLDEDGDGFGADPGVMAALEDCPQANPAGYVLNADDCDDTDALIAPSPIWYLDADGDGFGDQAYQVAVCSAPTGYVADNTDCDDSRGNVRPDALEDCLTAYDDNCDADNNDSQALNCITHYKDADGDGYGDVSDMDCICEPNTITGYTVQDNTDCDDTRNAVNPGVLLEDCDTTYDDNCNQDLNEIGSANCSNHYYDYDGDGFGTEDRLCLCEPMQEYQVTFTNQQAEDARQNDCDDINALINPAAQEVCDDFDVDEDCSGVADDAAAPGSVMWYRDGDGDGYGTVNTTIDQCDQPTGYLLQDGDCDDANPALNPGEIEICVLDPLTNQHRDEDCSGSDNDPNINDYNGGTTYYADVDGDGYGVAGDTVYACYADGSYTAVTDGDCDDTLNSVNPSQAEVCATSDDEDCDGQIDENGALDCTVYYKDVDNDGYGLGNDSVCSCVEQGDYRASIGADCDDEDALVNSGLGNCGLMGNVPASDAAYVIDQGYTDLTNNEGTFDYNNDGHIDMIAVDSSYDPVINGVQYNNAGGIFIFLGPFDGDLAKENADVTIGSNYGSDGLDVLWVGNLDADPADELLVRGNQSGMRIVQDGLVGLGLVDLEHQLVGGEIGASTVSYSMNSVNNNGRVLGDVDADGVLDFTWSTPSHSHFVFGIANNQGELSDVSNEYIQVTNRTGLVSFSGQPSGVTLLSYPTRIEHATNLINGHTITVDSNTSLRSITTEFTITDLSSMFINGDYTGISKVSASGDFNGDGFSDLAISAPGTDTYNNVHGVLYNSGLTCVMYHTGASSNPFVADVQDSNWCVRGESYSTYNGSYLTMGTILDINGDGNDDLVMFSAYDDNVLLYYGPLISPTDNNGNPRMATPIDADGTISGDTTFRPVSVKSFGDLNQDGFEDFVFYNAYLYLWYIYYGAPN